MKTTYFHRATRTCVDLDQEPRSAKNPFPAWWIRRVSNPTIARRRCGIATHVLLEAIHDANIESVSLSLVIVPDTADPQWPYSSMDFRALRLWYQKLGFKSIDHPSSPAGVMMYRPHEITVRLSDSPLALHTYQRTMALGTSSPWISPGTGRPGSAGARSPSVAPSVSVERRT